MVNMNFTLKVHRGNQNVYLPKISMKKTGVDTFFQTMLVMEPKEKIINVNLRNIK